ncbi:hypothetical protein GHT06_003777 [Daphnia sinensis]|uniref:KilA-N domain-containing protein n=1 Tax=Daphnia sinensis TaxID=1820382 RepID=A0AAD5KDK4_9CRUS|nr:hypothetical protein GHT06_003777 [Daphnia sinensis]
MWVNVTAIAKTEGKTWGGWYQTHQAKELVASIASRKGSDQDVDGSISVVDKGRINYKGVDSDKLRGTWVHADVAVAFAQHISPTYHAKWCAIQGKVLAGDHAAVADSPWAAKRPNDTMPARVVVRNGYALNVGEIFPMVDETGNVWTYGEVRDGKKLWVNATIIEKTLQTRWIDYYKLVKTKELIAEMESKCADLHTRSVVDRSRSHYQGNNPDRIRGTWIYIDLATAFVTHVDRSFEARWCAIKGRVYSGDHTAVADVLTETDRAAGTVSEAAVRTRRRTADDGRGAWPSVPARS